MGHNRARRPPLQAPAYATDFLRALLENGPMPAHRISSEARDAGLDRLEVLLAAMQLRCITFGKGGATTWALPEKEIEQ